MPVHGTDSHLPAVPPQRLAAAHVRARLVHAHAEPAEIAGDGRLAGDHREPAAAAVLVALLAHAEGLRVLLTERTAHLRDHAGQVSFPGGRTEPADADAEATALREAHEEVGLPPSAVEIIGRLPPYTTVTGFVVTPVVGLVAAPPPALTLDRFEVAEAFEVPLAFLMDPSNHRRHRVVHDGRQRQFLSMPWRRAPHEREYFIWGATAAMLRNLYAVLAR